MTTKSNEPLRIDKNSLDRFLPMFNVATNLSTRDGEKRYTFVLLLEEKRKNLFSLYAIRTFLGDEAIRSEKLLDEFFFGVVINEMGTTTENKNEKYDENKTFYDFLLEKFFLSSRPASFHESFSIKDFPTVILPSVYCYIISTKSLNVDRMVKEYDDVVSPFRDLLNYRAQLDQDLPHPRFRSSDDYLEQMLQSFRTACDVYCEKEDTSASLLPISDQFRTSDVLVIKKEVEDGNDDNDEEKLNTTKIDKSLVFRFREVFSTLDSRLFNLVRLNRDYPLLDDSMSNDKEENENDDNCKMNLTGDELVYRSFVLTLSMMFFCSRNRINDIVRHIEILSDVSNYKRENAYLRNFSSFCNWTEYVDVDSVRLNLSDELKYDKLLLEWLDNSTVEAALRDFCLRRTIFKLKLVPSNNLERPPIYDFSVSSCLTLDDNSFNFRYIFIFAERDNEGNDDNSSGGGIGNVYEESWRQMKAQLYDSTRRVVMKETSRNSLPNSRNRGISSSGLTIGDILLGKSSSSSSSDTILNSCFSPSIVKSAAVDSKITNSITEDEIWWTGGCHPFSTTDDSVDDSLTTSIVPPMKIETMTSISQPSKKRAAPPRDKWYVVCAQQTYGSGGHNADAPSSAKRLKSSKEDYESSKEDDDEPNPWINIVAIRHDLVKIDREKIQVVVTWKEGTSRSRQLLKKKRMALLALEKRRNFYLESNINGASSKDTDLTNNVDVANDENELDENEADVRFRERKKFYDFFAEKKFSYFFSTEKSSSITSSYRFDDEHLLFLEFLLTWCSVGRSILVNGNPGTGKTTVMLRVLEQMRDYVMSLAPTKLLRERMECIINRSLGVVADGSAYPNKSPAVPSSSSLTNSEDTGTVARVTPAPSTFSAIIRRIMCYNHNPKFYSRLIERHTRSELLRLFKNFDPYQYEQDFKVTKGSSARSSLCYPILFFVDEYNLTKWQAHVMLDEFCRSACIGRVLFGDSGQSSPIDGVNDNAELVALRCELSVQFLDNKRLVDSNDPLRELLSDQIWNWRSNSDNFGVTMYVRKLLRKHLGSYESREIDLSEDMRAWFEPLGDLFDWYDERSCRRYVTTRLDLCNILNRVSIAHFPRVISLTNRACDILNYRFSRALREYVDERVRLEREDYIAQLLKKNNREEKSRFLVESTPRNNRGETAMQLLLDSIRETRKKRKAKKNESFNNGPAIDSHNDANYRSRYDPSNYYLQSRRNARSNYESYYKNKRNIEHVVPSSLSFPFDLDCSLLVGRIKDDPWCSEITLSIGCVYRFIGESALLSRDSILVLLAFLPEEKNTRYRCNFADSINCNLCSSDILPTKGTHEFRVRGVGGPVDYVETSNSISYRDDETQNGMSDDMPKLLMLRVSGDQGKRRVFVCDSDAVPNDADGSRLAISRLEASSSHQDYEIVPLGENKDVFIISRCYYSLNRCNSLWTQSPRSSKFPRENMTLFGYPLVLHNAVTSYRVQGETIVGDKVYIDFDRMSKEHALVALSRIRSHEQLAGVINISTFGRL